MDFCNITQSSLTVLPPLAAVLLALLTRRVLVSLGTGIVLASMLLGYQSLDATWTQLHEAVSGVFIDGDELNAWNLYIISFLLLLGILTSLLSLSGATSAFSIWAQTKVRSARGARLMTVFAGMILFVDDYFNSLAVGSLSRPITDRYQVSRAKLAYLLDSTAAPTCVLAPFSSWGAYIIGLLGGLVAAHNIAPFSAFAQIMPLNFYALFALAMVALVAWFDWDLGVMKQHSQRAQQGELYNASLGTPPGEIGQQNESRGARALDLILPILTLIVSTCAAIVYVGARGLEGEFSLLAALENTDPSLALVYGSSITLVFTLILSLRLALTPRDLLLAIWLGIKSMLPAICILLFAWTLSSLIKELGTGQFLADQLSQTLAPALLPVLLFLLSAVMAFATGTSWGTFGIMLPIAADMAGVAAPELLLPSLAAVLSGSVFGDHSSPISDTSILSSTGAACHHRDHVITQLPYAVSGAIIAATGFLVLGLTGSALFGFACAGGILALWALLVSKLQS